MAQKRRRTPPAHLLLATWIVIVPSAVYLPINVQRRLSEGVIVPLSILAVVGLRLLGAPRARWRRGRGIVLALALPTSLLLLLGGTLNALSPASPAVPSPRRTAALDTLNAAVPADAIVLALARNRQSYLPARTDLNPYVGHGPETIDRRQRSRSRSVLRRDAQTRRNKTTLLRAGRLRVYFGPTGARPRLGRAIPPGPPI